MVCAVDVNQTVSKNMIHVQSSCFFFFMRKNSFLLLLVSDVSHVLGNMQSSQEHFKIIAYAKSGGQTECIMGDSKIENRLLLLL